MTDEFEDFVRSSGARLNHARTGEYPTYHQAWKRGRRRRLVKRGALASAGALTLVAGLVGANWWQGESTLDTDEVVLDSALVPAPTRAGADSARRDPDAMATTAPIIASDGSDSSTSAPDLEIAAAETGTADRNTADRNTADGLPTDSAGQEPTLATPVGTAAPTAKEPGTGADQTPTAQPTPNPAPLPPTAVPSLAPSVTPTQVPSSSVAASEQSTGAYDSESSTDVAVEESPTGQDSALPDDQTDSTSPSPNTTTTQPGPATGQNLSDLATARSIDDERGPIGEFLCDTDADGVADALCVPATYRCTGDDDVRVGYEPTDSNGDSKIDLCVSDAATTCDVTGDGGGDMLCKIGSLPQNSGTASPARP